MKLLTFISILLLSTNALSQSKGGKAKKSISVGIMALNSSTTQGGAGPSGSSILTRSEMLWSYDHFGYGVIFDYDLHGSNEKDSAYGIKLEATVSNFFFELGYLMSAKRAYTDRSIAEETGTGFVFGLGARFSLSRGGNSGPFFHASYKMKNQTLTKQDGVDLSESITQQDGYPVFGFGVSF